VHSTASYRDRESDLSTTRTIRKGGIGFCIGTRIHDDSQSRKDLSSPVSSLDRVGFYDEGPKSPGRKETLPAAYATISVP